MLLTGSWGSGHRSQGKDKVKGSSGLLPAVFMRARHPGPCGMTGSMAVYAEADSAEVGSDIQFVRQGLAGPSCSTRLNMCTCCSLLSLTTSSFSEWPQQQDQPSPIRSMGLICVCKRTSEQATLPSRSDPEERDWLARRRGRRGK